MASVARDDAVSHGESLPRAHPHRLRRKEGIEDPFSNSLRNSCPVVRDMDFNVFGQLSRRYPNAARAHDLRL